ncbi:TetR/AcrR family transcriptional regulator [Saccharothrix coeruleofusca]|uniref:Transcriptional regulator n=1 Tax=Saccharothrix coeruleofusca TaxID=33919 RepID=A0A918AMY6_9PSEU|nr:TetR/AcrR family transcriptional regulator [Saccharothrix coeruleofusca]MBP2340983.1 AcrR family transcriptional regulator [Saccharothrix coeruleofusca]GGP61237.1 transcriptional regulator [Saccharothrix coeruleofusca]
MSGRRLSSADRRAQLVGVARDVIATEGADALTLGRLAERAGISKPVVYDHFPSRAALLLSLYEDFDRRQIADLRAALERTPPDVRQRVEAIAAAHVACAVSQGVELGGVLAALVGTPELERARRESERHYLDLCRRAIHEADADADLDEAAAIAFLGAADALGQAAARGEIGPELARSTTAAVLRGLVGRAP